MKRKNRKQLEDRSRLQNMKEMMLELAGENSNLKTAVGYKT